MGLIEVFKDFMDRWHVKKGGSSLGYTSSLRGALRNLAPIREDSDQVRVTTPKGFKYLKRRKK